jgi:hypothetical protein
MLLSPSVDILVVSITTTAAKDTLLERQKIKKPTQRPALF